MDENINIEWESVDRCPVCNGERGKFSIENDDREINATIRVYYCPDCHCSYHNPRMSQNSMDKYYSSGLYRTHESRAYTDNADEKKYLSVKAKAIMIEAFCKDVKFEIRRSLDYGCGRGHLVKAMLERFGGEAIGYDIYKDPGATIEVIDSKDKITGKFDLITCTHVLEHLPYPITELNWMVNMLNKDGILFIEIPFTPIVFPPHPIIFSRETVPLLMWHIKARYMYYDAQFLSNNGLIVCQPNHPAKHAPMDKLSWYINYFRENDE